MTIYPGTTPDIPFIFPNSINLNELVQLWVTFKSSRMSPKKYEKTYDISQVTIDNDNHIITVHMTQEDTLDMTNLNIVEVQFRLLGPGDKARATKPLDIPIERILKGGVISAD